MNRKFLLIAAIALIAICIGTMLICGRTYTMELPPHRLSAEIGSADEITVETDAGIVVLTGKQISGGTLFLSFRSVHTGMSHVDVYRSGECIYLDTLYVHAGGVITCNTYFGVCSGGRVFSLSAFVFLALLLWYFLKRYVSGVKEDLYRYGNIRDLALVIFLASLLLFNIPILFREGALDSAVRSVMDSATAFAVVVLPLAFVISLLVTVSNVLLMKKEGITWRNMLGFLLGAFLCLCTVLPMFLENYLQHSEYINVHDSGGIPAYAEIFLENSIFFAVSYLECVLLATVILSIKAARRVPSFDRDCILILGCQINSDGSLTNLLKGRADRAVEFARMQKEASGRDIVFVPSGGRGADEIMSEAEAVRDYLIRSGIPAGRILTEDRSSSTYENFRYSMELIRETAGPGDPKIAFSTTNYHVFRSGAIASAQGIRAEGIGSGTKRYFWINAFIREFIAALHSERSTHLKAVLIMLLAELAMVSVILVSNVM